MRFPTFTGVLAALAVVFTTVPAFATEQGRDAMAFAGQQDSILERPLNDFLKRLPVIPRFDIPSTANYKGYTASWEVKDSRLYLATFHIVGGRETLAEGRYTYKRVTALQVTNGLVIATNRMTNRLQATPGGRLLTIKHRWPGVPEPRR